MRSVDELERALLQPSVLPASWMKRNKVQYELVTYVHHALVLWRAGRSDGAAAFGQRARDWLDANADVELGGYRRLVEELVSAIGNRSA